MDAILFSGEPLPLEAREHLAQCASCQALAGALGDSVAYTVDSATLERARTGILPSLAPVKPLAPATAFTGLFLLIAAAVAAGVAALLGFKGLRALAPEQGFAIFVFLLALLSLAAFAIARDMRPGAWTVRSSVIFALAFVAIEALFLTLFPGYSMGSFVHQGVPCFSVGMACSALTALLAWLAVRRGYVVAPVSTGAAIGALAGLAGLTALELHCPILLVPHLAVWHVAVLVASVGLGAAAGRMARMKSSA